MGGVDAARRARGGHRARRARAARRLRELPPAGADREDGGDGRTRSAAAASSLGLGAGWNETEYRAFGLPYDHRVSRFEESFEIVRRLLAGERVTLDGPLLAGGRRRRCCRCPRGASR